MYLTVPSGQKCAKRPVLPEGEIYTVVPPVIMKSSVPIKEISTASGAVKNWKRSARVGKGTVPVVGSVAGKLGKRKKVVTMEVVQWMVLKKRAMEGPGSEYYFY
ncbi:hypothetical protein SLA2020_337710 [Shorea laevis]